MTQYSVIESISFYLLFYSKMNVDYKRSMKSYLYCRDNK